MKKYKGFYPSWYIEKRNNECFKKFKGYVIFILVINLLLVPDVLKKGKDFNLETEKKRIYEKGSVLNELVFLLNKNIGDFVIENNRLEFKVSKNDFKNKLQDLEKKINIRSVEEVLEEAYLIKGEFYDK